MSIQLPVVLTKGVPVTLTKEDGTQVSLKSVHVGAGWDKARGAESYDLDLMFFLLKGPKEKVVVTQSNGKQGLVYFGDKTSACGSIVLDKDNRTGAGDGFDENGNLNLETIPDDINCIPVVINIFNGHTLGQTFGQIENAHIQLNIAELPPIKADLTEDFSDKNIVHVADIYRGEDRVWKVKKIALGLTTGYPGLVAEYS